MACDAVKLGGVTDLDRHERPSAMTATPDSNGPSNAAQDVPSLGLIRPPLVYLASLVIGALIQFAQPLPFLPRRLTVALGASLVVVAIALF